MPALYPSQHPRGPHSGRDLITGQEHREVDTEACWGFLEKDEHCRFLTEKGKITFHGTVFMDDECFSKKSTGRPNKFGDPGLISNKPIS